MRLFESIKTRSRKQPLEPLGAVDMVENALRPGRSFAALPPQRLWFSFRRLECACMEPTEMNKFSEEMHEASEAGMRNISLAISVLAVLVAMVTVLGHRTHTEAVLLQTRSADQWNLYQAKKIRQVQFSTAMDLLLLQPSADKAGAEQKVTEYKAHMKKWAGELNAEQHEAQELEREVDGAERRADRYDLSEALLEIAVVLCSITLLTRQQIYFIFGLSLALIGLLAGGSALLIH